MEYQFLPGPEGRESSLCGGLCVCVGLTSSGWDAVGGKTSASTGCVAVSTTGIGWSAVLVTSDLDLDRVSIGNDVGVGIRLFRLFNFICTDLAASTSATFVCEWCTSHRRSIAARHFSRMATRHFTGSLYGCSYGTASPCYRRRVKDTELLAVGFNPFVFWNQCVPSISGILPASDDRVLGV